ncbi:LIM domain protein [Cooperia oncophora]
MVDPQKVPYCTSCYMKKFAPRCVACNQPITPREGETTAVQYIVMNKTYHPTCFKCEDCGMQLSNKGGDEGCYPLNDHLYCKKCHIKRKNDEKK